jgi:hypothetical protein
VRELDLQVTSRTADFACCGEHGGPTLDITACALAFDELRDGVWASDHFGIVADLSAPTRPRPES